MIKSMVYLGLPYSHPDLWMRKMRFHQANRAAAVLMGAGLHLFSPISHTHPIALAGDLPLGWDYWESYDRAVLQTCVGLVVLELPGWEESTGLAGEIKIASEPGSGIFIEHVTMENCNAEFALNLKDKIARLAMPREQPGPHVTVVEKRPVRSGRWYTTREQDMVRDFNIKMGASRTLDPATAELRARLIEEEARETADALRAGDLVGTVDGLCDLQYVLLGAADVAGVPLGAFFDEVHRTNMLKLDGPRREDGKIGKPAGWQPPKIREMIGKLSEDRWVSEGAKEYKKAFSG